MLGAAFRCVLGLNSCGNQITNSPLKTNSRRPRNYPQILLDSSYSVSRSFEETSGWILFLDLYHLFIHLVAPVSPLSQMLRSLDSLLLLPCSIWGVASTLGAFASLSASVYCCRRLSNRRGPSQSIAKVGYIILWLQGWSTFRNGPSHSWRQKLALI